MRVVVKQVQKGGRTDISSVSSWLSSMLLVSWNHQIQRKHPKFVNDWTFILFRRSNVPDGPFFWWRLSHIWTWGNCLVHISTIITLNNFFEQDCWLQMHCVLFFSDCDLLCDVQLFSSQVIAFAEQDQEDRLDPLIYVFPRMTKVRLSRISWVLESARYKKQDQIQTGLDRSASWSGSQEVKE